MIHDHWVHVGRDADGEVYVSEGVDLEGMREVRLGDGRRERFRPGGPVDWLDTLTHWVAAPWPPPSVMYGIRPHRPMSPAEHARARRHDKQITLDPAAIEQLRNGS